MIEVTFSNSTHETTAFGLTQWDKGQKLKIIWSDAPSEFQVHFSSRGSDEAIVVQAKGEAGVAVADIPDELLKVSEDIFAWIYVSENDVQGESVKRAVLYVRPRPKPQNILDEIEPSQQEKLEIILKDIKQSVDYMKENGTDAEYIPEYVINEADSLAQKINEVQDENTVVIMLSSDAHLKTGDYNSDNSIRHMSQAMRLISQKCPVNFAAYLGDMTAGGSEKSINEAKKEFMNVSSYLYPVFSQVPSLRCHGSEDNLHKAFYRNGKNITDEELYSYIGKWNSKAACTEDNEKRGYCCMDLEKEKIRVICLNTSETGDTELTPTSETAIMSAEQLNWFCRALDLSSKSDCADWGIIVLGHHPLNMSGKFNAALSIIDKYTAGESVNIMLADSSVISYDFSGKNSAEILAQFHGHLHNYRVNFITDKNIPLIAVPNASLNDSNFYADPSYSYLENTEYAEDKTFSKVAGSADDTAFCVAVLDKTSGVINVLHYGAGKDRVVACGTVSDDIPEDDNGNENDGNENPGEGSGNTGEDNNGNTGDGSGEEYVYTNLVPVSLSLSNGPYGDGNGYVNNYILTSANSLYHSSGYTHTGYISASEDDVIRVSGGTFDGSIGNYLIITDSNHKVLYVKSVNSYAELNAGVSYTDSGILVFEPSKISGEDLSNMAYIRVSTKADGADLIVTVNEEIDGSEISSVAPPMISYTNIMRFALDENGAEFGTGGYKNGRILNKNAEEVDKNNSTVTGYFEVEPEAVLRIKGLIFDGTEGCCICVYDSSHQLLYNISVNATSFRNYGLVYENGIHIFTPLQASVDMSNIAYVRFSGKGSGSTVLITYDEEII